MPVSRSELKQAYSDFISQQPFDLFLTVTSDHRTHPEALEKRIHHIRRAWARDLFGPNFRRKKLSFEGVIAIERHKSWNPHAHCLFRSPLPNLPLPIDHLQSIATRTGGWCKAEAPRSQADTVDYCAKYAIKEGEILFTKDWQPVDVQRSFSDGAI